MSAFYVVGWGARIKQQFNHLRNEIQNMRKHITITITQIKFVIHGAKQELIIIIIIIVAESSRTHGERSYSRYARYNN
jgi:hypothetical protein